MANKSIQGGAAPVLAVHSKDASLSGFNPEVIVASPGNAKSGTDGIAQTVSRIADQAKEAAGNVTMAISNDAAETSETLSPQNASSVATSGFVRERPLTALMTASAIGMLFGLLLPRR